MYVDSYIQKMGDPPNKMRTVWAWQTFKVSKIEDKSDTGTNSEIPHIKQQLSNLYCQTPNGRVQRACKHEPPPKHCDIGGITILPHFKMLRTYERFWAQRSALLINCGMTKCSLQPKSPNCWKGWYVCNGLHGSFLLDGLLLSRPSISFIHFMGWQEDYC